MTKRSPWSSESYRRPLTLLAAACLAIAAPALAEPPTAADFAWLAGDWIGQAEGGVIEEMWAPPAAGTLLGMMRWTDENSVKLYELMSIEDADAGPVLILRHFSPGLGAWEPQDAPMVFKLDAVGDQKASFINTTEKQVTRLTYHRTEGGLEVELEQIQGGERSTTTFSFRPRP